MEIIQLRTLAALLCMTLLGCAETPLETHSSALGDPPDSMEGAELPAAKEDKEPASTCHQVDQASQTLLVRTVHDVPPIARGGTIAPGTYVLFDATLYVNQPVEPTAEPETMSMTVRISGSMMESIREGIRRTGELSYDGTFLKTTETCPERGEISESPYTATPSTLTIHGKKRSHGTPIYSFARVLP